MKRGRGRPLKEPDDLITLDTAVEAILEHLTKKYGAVTAAKLSYSKGTLYNKSSKGDLHVWKKGKYVLVSEREVLKLVS